MSKAILIADLHAGVKSDSEIFLTSFKHVFEKFIPETIKERNLIKPKIFILGDLFHNRDYISSKTINVVIDTFEKFLLINDLELYIILGNHDLYLKNSREINSCKILHDKFPNIKIITDLTRLKIDNRKVVLCPWIINSRDSEELFSEKADICLLHAEINGFEVVKGHREDNGLSPDLFKKYFKLTFSGHFHIRSEINGITYIGNPYQINWGDTELSKGMYLLDFETLQSEFIENIHSSKFKKIYLSKIKKKEVDLKKDIPNNFISLVLDSEINSSDLDKLNYLISSLQPLSFEIADAEKIFNVVTLSDFSTTPVEYLNEYIDAIDFGMNIEKEILKRKISELYQGLNI